MTTTYNNTVKNARLQVVADAIAAGSVAGKLQIGTAAMALLLVEVDLDDPPIVASQVLTLLGSPSTGTAGASGTAAAAQVVDSDDNVIASGLTVGTSGTDVVLNSVAISNGQNVEIDSATITHG